jgi:dolichol-phosphate mannosyltransferase
MLSVVTVFYNERATLPEFYRRVLNVLQALQCTFEIILVDDGSTDGSGEYAAALAAGDSQVRCVQLSRNFGHQIAITAGLDYAAGQAIVSLDSDLQQPPESIPDMVSKWREGFEVVQMVRSNAIPGTGSFKRFTASCAYRGIAMITGLNLPVGAADFRLLDRKVVDSLRRMPERDRFLRGLVSWVGFRHTVLRYRVAARFAGTSKYTFPKMLRLALTGIVTFSPAPLYLVFYLGLIGLGLGATFVLRMLFEILATGTPPDMATLILGVSVLLVSAQLVGMGILGYYVGRIYDQVRARPLYLVSRLHGFEELSANHKLPEG